MTRRARVVLATPFVVLVGLGLLLPMIAGLLATLTTYSPGENALRFVGLTNYARLLGDHEFAAAVRNVVVLTAIAVGLELALGFLLALLLRGPFRGRRVARVLLLVPWLLSPIGSGVMWHFLFGTNGGLLDFGLAIAGLQAVPSPASQPGLALATVIVVEAWRTVPLVAFLLLPAVERVPSDRLEDARMHGAGWFASASNVVAPAVYPVLAAVALLIGGLSLGTFDSVLVLTGGGPGTATLTPALYAYEHAFQSADWSVGTAAAWLVVIGVAVLGIVYVRVVRREEQA